MKNVTILLDGETVVDRDVDSLECEETAGGTLTMHATFPPSDVDWLDRNNK